MDGYMVMRRKVWLSSKRSRRRINTYVLNGLDRSAGLLVRPGRYPRKSQYSIILVSWQWFTICKPFPFMSWLSSGKASHYFWRSGALWEPRCCLCSPSRRRQQYITPKNLGKLLWCLLAYGVPLNWPHCPESEGSRCVLDTSIRSGQSSRPARREKGQNVYTGYQGGQGAKGALYISSIRPLPAVIQGTKNAF